MSTPERAAEMRRLANIIEKRLNRIYGVKMGFFITLSPMDNSSPIADYIGNVQRESAVEWMRETIGRFERDEVIPEPTNVIRH